MILSYDANLGRMEFSEGRRPAGLNTNLIEEPTGRELILFSLAEQTITLCASST